MSFSGSSTARSATSNQDYFSMDDILATQERIPSKFELPVYNLGEI